MRAPRSPVRRIPRFAGMSDLPKAPSHLRAATRRWFAEIAAAYDLLPHHVDLLVLAAENRDRCELAREVLAKRGLTYVDKKGALKARPEVQIAKDTAIVFARMIRELRLDPDGGLGRENSKLSYLQEAAVVRLGNLAAELRDEM